MSDVKSSVLSVRDLRKTYPRKGGDVEVLKGVSFDLLAGETIGVVGVSGAGKTTLLQILGTLDAATSGSVTYEGVDVSSRGEAELAAFRNRTIGFVFQFHHLLPEFDAVENVMLPRMIAGVGRDEAREGAVALLKDVGLGHRLDHAIGELSGGEQQRVAICRALSMGPRILLADEPTGNLDRETARSVMDALSALNRERGLTMVIVTHNDELASRMGKNIRLVDGRVAT